AKLALAHMRDQHRAGAFEALEAYDLEAAIGEEAAHLRVADRHIGRDHADPLCPIALQRRSRRIRPHRDLDARARLDPLMQLLAALESGPERLRGHAHDQIVGLAGHDLIDRPKQLLTDVVHELSEIGVVADRIIWDMDTAEV